MEIWKSIPQFEGHYQVSDEGRVRSLDKTVNTAIRHNQSVLKRGKVLKCNLKRNGYYSVDLCVKNTKKTISVHRIVASTFIENPLAKSQVNHKNGVKTDNRVSNLEWATRSENQQHRFTQLGQTGKRKKVLCKETGTIHESSKFAAIWVNQSKYQNAKQITALSRKIRKCCVGEKATAYGLQWEYVV